MKNVLRLITIALIQLMLLSSSFSCELTASLVNQNSTEKSIKQEYKKVLASIAKHDCQNQSKQASSHSQDHCKECSTCGCFCILKLNHSVTYFSFEAFPTFYFDLRFIYKQPFINFDSKPPIFA
jgi:hypothetical protein